MQAEVIKYTIEGYSVGYTAGFYVAMNLDKWNSLPADIKKIVETINREWIPKHGKAWDDSDKAGREFTLSKGHEIIPLSKEESARWARTVRPVIDTYIKKTEEKGLPGKAYVDTLKALVKKYQ